MEGFALEGRATEIAQSAGVAPDDPGRAGAAAPVLPGYDVGRFLGRGGSATVWLATEKSTGRKVALKCFRPAAGATGEGTDPEAELRREIRVLSALDHGHLVKVQAVVRLNFTGGGRGDGDDGGKRDGDGGGRGDGDGRGVGNADGNGKVDTDGGGKADADGRGGENADRGGLGLVLDYAPGGSLAALVAGRGRLGVGETVTVLTPIAQALAYLHAQGFTHGDIAPGNVLFTAQGKPLLADLGVARMVADASPAAVHGTDGFRDPAPVEAVRAGLQPEGDIYSLAALGWFCLSGRAPEPGQQRPPLPLLVPEVPADLAAALEAGLKDDRRLRPTAAELAAAIYRSARAEPVDLSGSVHPTVIPELLTRRRLPSTPGEVRAERLRRWSGDIGRRMRRGPSAGTKKEAAPSSGSRHTPPPGPPTALGSPRRARHAAAGTAGAARGISAGGPLGGRRGGLHGVRALTVLVLLTVVSGAWLLAGTRLTLPFPLSAAGPATGDDGRLSPSPPGPAGPEPVPPTTVPQDIQAMLASADPAQAVRGLSRLRALAFNSGDLSLLEDVNVPGSPAAAADARTGARLRESGHVLTGFTNVLTAVERAADSGPWRTVLAVNVAPSAYQERDAAGAIVAEAGAADEQRLRLVLVQVDGRWRIQEILPANHAPG